MRGTGWIVALSWLCLGGAALAQTGTVYSRTGSGARAAGMANAFIAISDDGTAASWNPAGLGQLRNLELSIVTTTSGREVGSEGFRSRDDQSIYGPSSSAYKSTYLDFASLAVPLRIATRPVTLQAAWRRLYTFDYRENVEIQQLPTSPLGPPPVLFGINGDTAGGIDVLALAGAVKLTPRLALGGGVNLWRGAWQADAAISAAPSDGTTPPIFASERDEIRLDGHNWSLGLLLTYPRWSVGVLFQGPLRGSYANHVSVRNSSEPQLLEATQQGDVRFAPTLGVGAAWRPTPRWTVALDLTHDQWTGTLLKEGDGPEVDLFNGLPPGLSGTRDTLSANAGAECLLHGEGFVVPLRFGVAWEPQGPRNAYTRDPVNFVTLAVGSGYNTNALKFDAALQYRQARFQDGSNFGLQDFDGYLPSAVGERNIQEWRVKVSIILRMTDSTKLHRTLKRIFG